MKRLVLVSALLVILLLKGSCGAPPPRSVGLVVHGGPDAAGAVVSVNGIVLGRMKPEAWISTSPAGTAPGAGPAASERDSSLASRLDARVPSRRWSRIMVVSEGGTRLQIQADLRDSLLVWVSFPERSITATPASEHPTPMAADTSAEGDD